MSFASDGTMNSCFQDSRRGALINAEDAICTQLQRPFLLLRKEEEHLPFASEWHDEFEFPRFRRGALMDAEDAVLLNYRDRFLLLRKEDE